MVGRGDDASRSTSSSSLTSNGIALAKQRDDEDDDEELPEELALSRSLKTISSCAESHSAVNVHASSRELPGGDGPTTGEFGRLR